MNDPVNHPSHYTDGKIEVLDFIEDKKLNYHRGNAVKYICRAGKKDPAKEAEDLEKAVFYLNREIELIKSKEVKKTSPTYSFDSSTTSEEAQKYVNEWDEIDNKFHEAVISLIAKASGTNFERSKYDYNWDITKEVIDHAISIICPDLKLSNINY